MAKLRINMGGDYTKTLEQKEGFTGGTKMPRVISLSIKKCPFLYLAHQCEAESIVPRVI